MVKTANYRLLLITDHIIGTTPISGYTIEQSLHIATYKKQLIDTMDM